ncbi:MAG TPA: hypothetical protein VGR27_08090 [Longimicrobiaceae bacterium]|nr:hypothetical protein [Longimicrobiaceae bacterium]
MQSRFRLFAALLALLAFSAYFAEGVWASMCPPGMEAGMNMMAQMDGASGSDMGGMHHASPSAPDDSGTSRSGTPPCPFAVAGVGSCVAASLPATGTSVQPLLAATSVVTLSPDAGRDLLLVTTLFHPPRA